MLGHHWNWQLGNLLDQKIFVLVLQLRFFGDTNDNWVIGYLSNQFF